MMIIYFAFRSLLAPPTYTQYPLPVDNQNHDSTASYQSEDALVLPARNLPPHIDRMTTVTIRVRVFFIICGIIFLILGSAVLGIEISIMMYSFSTYYRGIWSGNMMLTIAISMLVVAGQTSHSIRFTKNLLTFNLVTAILGVLFSVVELTAVQPCADGNPYSTCESTVGKVLKLVMIGVLNFSLLFSLAVLTCVQLMRR